MEKAPPEKEPVIKKSKCGRNINQLGPTPHRRTTNSWPTNKWGENQESNKTGVWETNNVEGVGSTRRFKERKKGLGRNRKNITLLGYCESIARKVVVAHKKGRKLTNHPNTGARLGSNTHLIKWEMATKKCSKNDRMLGSKRNRRERKITKKRRIHGRSVKAAEMLRPEQKIKRKKIRDGSTGVSG